VRDGQGDTGDLGFWKSEIFSKRGLNRRSYLKSRAKLVFARNALSAEQLHDDGGAEHEDDLNQPLCRKYLIERRHL
jgi:hypothetical protein